MDDHWREMSRGNIDFWLEFFKNDALFRAFDENDARRIMADLRIFAALIDGKEPVYDEVYID